MNNEGYAIRALVVLLIYLSFGTDLCLIQQRFIEILFSTNNLKFLLGSFNLSLRRSQWSMDNTICIFIFQYNFRICAKNGAGLFPNILIICDILWCLAFRLIFKGKSFSGWLPDFGLRFLHNES